MVGFLLSTLGQFGAMAQSSPEACVPPKYKVTELPLHPAAVNGSLEVAGTSMAHRAAIWKNATGLTELPLPAGYAYSEAVAINSVGDVVGNAHNRDFTRQLAFLYTHGVLKVLPGNQARAYGINDAAVVAGAALAAEGRTTVPVVWDKHGMRTPSQCCGGSATGINQSGHTIGDIYDDQGRFHAFLWSGAADPEQIGPRNRYSTAIAVNGKDHVVVQTFPAILLYSDGSLRRLHLHPHYPSKPLAINNCDVVVGAFGPFSDADRAFVWDDRLGFQDLNTKIPPQSGWKLESATGIDDDGVIVGRGDHDGRDDVGFLLMPDR